MVTCKGVGGLSQNATMQWPEITRNSMQFMLLLPGQSSPPSSNRGSSESLLILYPGSARATAVAANARMRALASKPCETAAGIKRPERRPLPAFSDRSSVCRSVDRWVKGRSDGLLFKETISITLFHIRTLPILYHCIGCFEVQS